MGKYKEARKLAKRAAKNDDHLPTVSLCTPTYNRRPFISMMVRCIERQLYPKNKIEWLILDDGTDPIGDLVSHLPYVRYMRYELSDGRKMPLGMKRNRLNAAARGDILVYIDDDDYYPPMRIRHAVDRLLEQPWAMIAGSTVMLLYFPHLGQMYEMGPYGYYHATAATFAFWRRLLEETSFSEDAAVAEEKFFLKNHTIPMVQLDPLQTICVVSHDHNSFDKKQLLVVPNTMEGRQLHERTLRKSSLTLSDLIAKDDPESLRFFLEELPTLLDAYPQGAPTFKHDVIQNMEQIHGQRIKKQQEVDDERRLYNYLIKAASTIKNK